MKRLTLNVLLGVIAISVLAGCATGGGTAENPTLGSSGSTTQAAPSAGDPQAQAKAQAWLDAAALPPGAIPSESAPPTTVSFNLETYQWWCSPMEELTAYWTVAGATVTDTGAWLSEHPPADLIVPHRPSLAATEGTDIVSVGMVTASDSLEGIVYTVAKSPDGVAIRARIGVLTDSTVCPSPEAGTNIGGPGQG